MSRYRTIDLLDKRLVCRDEKFMSAHEIVEELQDLEQRLAAAESRTCEWQEDSDTDSGAWLGECGAVWEFIADGPAENNCNFCPECGGKLVIAECSQQGSSEKVGAND